MDLLRSLHRISQAEEGPIDWRAVTDATKASTPPGELSLTEAERRGYHSDVVDARGAIRARTELTFVLPDRLEIQHRHHWIDANVDTFERLMAPIATSHRSKRYGGARVLNTGSMSLTLSILARHVLGQYDPLLLAEDTPHAMYFVHPNIVRVADELDVDRAVFRRWIAFHEVTHAAEFGAAPWLSDYLETRLQAVISELAHGQLDRTSMRELDAAMTAVEGFAELLMDEAFDLDSSELRAKLDKRRQQLGPLRFLFDRLLGLQTKRRQYERGKAFFEAVNQRRDIKTAGLVWDRPDALPTWDEFDTPDAWLRRMDA